jgi:hypothetical protein
VHRRAYLELSFHLLRRTGVLRHLPPFGSPPIALLRKSQSHLFSTRISRTRVEGALENYGGRNSSMPPTWRLMKGTETSGGGTASPD